MCCNTKMRIAQALRQLMEQRPLSKITVQDLMECTHMTRQSFYYHFQDIYAVLLWSCEQQIGQPLRENPDASLETWCIQALTLLEKDRAFYRHVFSAPEQTLLQGYCEELVWSRICLYLFQEEEKKALSPTQVFVVDFYTKAVVNYFMERITARNPVNQAEACKCLRGLLAALRPVNSDCFHARAS